LEDRGYIVDTVALEDVLDRRLGPLVGEVRDRLHCARDAGLDDVDEVLAHMACDCRLLGAVDDDEVLAEVCARRSLG